MSFRPLSFIGLIVVSLAVPALVVPQNAAVKAARRAAPQLPVRRVVLYKNGVGYFEHAGPVMGNQAVSIDFTTAQLNDVLQSFTALDLNGGTVPGVGYNSTSPLGQQLKSIPLALGESPTIADLFAALRGASVVVTAGAVSITGRLVNIEVEDDTKGETTVSRRLLSVLGDNGSLRVFELTPAVNVRLVDAELNKQLSRYLNLIATTRDQDLRHLTLSARGIGERELRVSYISEVPVWKSAYRLVFPQGEEADKEAKGGESAFLQGWAVIDNTIGSDWDNVQLSLVAGAPQSFIQPLSTPYYTRRPELGLPEAAMTTPQTHESGDEVEDGLRASSKMPRDIKMVKEDGAPPQSVPGVAGMQGLGSSGGVAGGMLGGIGTAPMPEIRYGIRNAMTEEVLTGSNPVDTSKNAFDDFFEYKLTQPITIHKNESALVPILQAKVTAERVTLWSAAEPQPLRAVWLTNTSDLTLDRGSFTILENGEFAGEGLLDPIHAMEKRLLSYAADDAVRVDTGRQKSSEHLQRIAIAKGVLTEIEENIEEQTYTVRNAAAAARTVVVEHPVRQGWELDSEVKPVETSPSSYRFRVETKAGESVVLHVGEKQVVRQRYSLTDVNAAQLTVILDKGKASDKLAEALAPILAAKREVGEINLQIMAKQNERNATSEDQKRIRENLATLKGSTEERGLAKRYAGEMNQQEDKLAALARDIEVLALQRTAAEKKVADLIANLQMEAEFAA